MFVMDNGADRGNETVETRVVGTLHRRGGTMVQVASLKKMKKIKIDANYPIRRINECGIDQ